MDTSTRPLPWLRIANLLYLPLMALGFINIRTLLGQDPAWISIKKQLIGGTVGLKERITKHRIHLLIELFISENVRPGGYRDFEAGHWVAEPNWPSDNIKERAFFLTQQKSLTNENNNEGQLSICSPQDCGVACGEIFSLKPDSELSGDQRIDDAGSLAFETAVLEESMTLLGRPQIKLAVSIDRPLGNIAVRLVDVHPDGTSHRVSWGVLNLAHRQDNESLSEMTAGQV